MIQLLCVMNKHYIVGIFAGFALLASAFTGCRKTESAEPQPERKVSEIVITEPASGKMTLIQGESERIRFTVVPEELLNTAVIEWTSSDEAVATVRNGRVNAYAPGTATVTASCGDANAQVKVTVTAIPVESFSVPDKVEMYVGISQKLKVEVSPKGTNAASLEWKISDPQIVSLTFAEGEAVLSALKKGTCTIEVSYGMLKSQTIKVETAEYADRMAVYYVNGSGKTVDIADGAELSTFAMSSSGGYRYFVVKHLPSSKIDLSKLSVRCDDSQIADLRISAAGNEAKVVVVQKHKFGSCMVDVRYEDMELDMELTRKFTLVSEAGGYSSPYTLKAVYDSGDIVTFAEGDNIQIGQNSSMTLSVNGNYPLKWSMADPSLCKMTVTDGDEYWASKVSIATSGATGKTELVLVDQKGGERRFDFEVTKPMFPESLYVIDESTGLKVSGKIEMFEGESRTFRLSDDNYIGKWVCSNNLASVETLDGGRRAKVTAENASWTGCSLYVDDEAGANRRTVALDVLSVIDPSTYKLVAVYGTDKGGDYNFDWKGNATDFVKEFKLVDKDGFAVSLYGLTMGYTFPAEGEISEDCLSFGDKELNSRARSFTFSWEKEFTRYLTIWVADRKGHRVSRKIVPVINLSDPYWHLFQKKGSTLEEVDLGSRNGVITGKFMSQVAKDGNPGKSGYTASVWDDYYMFFRYTYGMEQQSISGLYFTPYILDEAKNMTLPMNGRTFRQYLIQYRTYCYLDIVFETVIGADGKKLRLKMEF